MKISPIKTLVASICSAAVFSVLFVPNTLAASEFSDIASDDPLSPVVTELKSRNIIGGYSDGTFRPNNKVNRAEALKIVVAPLVSPSGLEEYTTTPFTDIEAGAWYVPFVEYARTELQIIDGPPSKTAFHGTDAVKKVEFIKMLLLANDVNPDTYNEISLALSGDVTNSDEWYYPYFRYAVSASMVEVDASGMLSPGAELTRGDTATLLFYFLMYTENRRTQALLSQVEVEIVRILSAIEENNVVQAEYAAARGLLAAKGAHASRPEASVTKSTLKIAEAYEALVRAYRAGVGSQFDTVIKVAGDAYRLADEAKTISPDVSGITDQIQKSAKDMADSARELQ